MTGKKQRLHRKHVTAFKEDTELALVYDNSDIVGYRAAWKQYVRGGIVSETAAQLIRNYLQVCNANVIHDGE